MNTNHALKWLISLIFVLTLIATLPGLWPAEGQPYPVTNFRGEQVTINASGLVHHGGFGTTAAGFRAGIPSFTNESRSIID